MCEAVRSWGSAYLLPCARSPTPSESIRPTNKNKYLLWAGRIQRALKQVLGTHTGHKLFLSRVLKSAQFPDRMTSGRPLRRRIDRATEKMCYCNRVGGPRRMQQGEGVDGSNSTTRGSVCFRSLSAISFPEGFTRRRQTGPHRQPLTRHLDWSNRARRRTTWSATVYDTQPMAE
jgi:hypothetical protein